jgi:hypothetical protein
MAVFAQIHVWKKDEPLEDTELIYQHVDCEATFVRRMCQIKEQMKSGLISKAKADWFNTKESRTLCEFFNKELERKDGR